MTNNTDFMNYPAIDVHGHCGQFRGYTDHLAAFLSAPPEEVSRRAAACAIEITLVSELGALSVPADDPDGVRAGNVRALKAAEEYDNLRFYAVVNPKQQGWEHATEQLLEHSRCAGVKLHPWWDKWDVDDQGERVFGFLQQRKVLTLTHTGHPGSEPERFVPWANRYPSLKLILAHMGNDVVDNTRDRQIKAVKKAHHGNLWVDTSSAMSITPRLIEYAVDQIGADRIVFGSDTPVYFAAMQKARIAYAEISDGAKQKILYENGAALLGGHIFDQT